jgi:hypothetical protein
MVSMHVQRPPRLSASPDERRTQHALPARLPVPTAGRLLNQSHGGIAMAALRTMRESPWHWYRAHALGIREFSLDMGLHSRYHVGCPPQNAGRLAP